MNNKSYAERYLIRQNQVITLRKRKKFIRKIKHTSDQRIAEMIEENLDQLGGDTICH